MDQIRLDSVDVLKDFHASLWKFIEKARTSLGEADADLQRTLMWLETEQRTHWQHQIHKRTEIVSRAKDAVRAKKMFRNVDNTRPSAIEEEKALAIAQRSLEEAHHKAAAVKKYSQKLQKEMLVYRGQVQRLASSLQVELPQAAGMLEQLIESVESYLGIAPASGAEASQETSPTEPSAPSMRRGSAAAPAEEESEPASDAPDESGAAPDGD